MLPMFSKNSLPPIHRCLSAFRGINIYLPSRFTFLPLICSTIILDTSGSLKLSMHPLCRPLSSFHFATGHFLQRVFVQNSPICRIVSSLFVMCAISLLHFFQLCFGFFHFHSGKTSSSICILIVFQLFPQICHCPHIAVEQRNQTTDI